MHHCVELVAKWDATAKAAPSKATRSGDEVSDDERARRVAEHVQCAPSPDFLDALERGLLEAQKTGASTHIVRKGRGAYFWRVGNDALHSEGFL